jgi:peptidoglycan hydrolase CwlO-like protein
MQEETDEEQARMQDQVNKHVYLADMKDKFLTEISQVALRVIKKAGNQSKYQKEVQQLAEINNQKKQLENNIRGKQELHIKSVMFERDNLQMELEEALGQIDKLEQEVEDVRQTVHSQMDIANPYGDLEEIGGKLQD